MSNITESLNFYSVPITKNGYQLFIENKVNLTVVNDFNIHGTIKDDSLIYMSRVKFNPDYSILEMNCSCSPLGFYCKHIAALIYSFDKTKTKNEDFNVEKSITTKPNSLVYKETLSRTNSLNYLNSQELRKYFTSFKNDLTKMNNEEKLDILQNIYEKINRSNDCLNEFYSFLNCLLNLKIVDQEIIKNFILFIFENFQKYTGKTSYFLLKFNYFDKEILDILKISCECFLANNQQIKSNNFYKYFILSNNVFNYLNLSNNVGKTIFSNTYNEINKDIVSYFLNKASIENNDELLVLILKSLCNVYSKIKFNRLNIQAYLNTTSKIPFLNLFISNLKFLTNDVVFNTVSLLNNDDLANLNEHLKTIEITESLQNIIFLAENSFNFSPKSDLSIKFFIVSNYHDINFNIVNYFKEDLFADLKTLTSNAKNIEENFLNICHLIYLLYPIYQEKIDLIIKDKKLINTSYKKDEYRCEIIEIFEKYNIFENLIKEFN